MNYQIFRPTQKKKKNKPWCCCCWSILLEMLKKHLYVIRSLSWGKKFTIQQSGSCCHTANSVTNYLNENAPDYIKKQDWSPNSCDLNLLDYAIWNIMKKILYKNLKWYEGIEGLSAAMHVIDWQKKSSTIQLTNCGHIVYLIWQHRLIIPRTFL